MPDRKIAPPYHEISPPQIPSPGRTELENGIPVSWVNIGIQEAIRIECIFPAIFRNEDNPSISFFTTRMLWEGTSGSTSTQISQALDLYGAFTDTVHTPDYFGLVVYTMPKFLNEILPILSDVLSDATLPEKEWENLRNITVQQLKVNQMQNSWLARANFKATLFGENTRYGYTQRVEDLQNLEIENLRKYYTDRIKHTPFRIFVSGKVEDKSLDLIAKHFGGKSLKQPAVEADFTKFQYLPVTPGRIAIPREDSSQYTLRIGRQAPVRTDADFFKILVTNEILGGYFGSRLMKNIREEKGLTYGISSYLPALKDASYFMIATDVNKASLDEILDEIRKEILLLQTGSVTEDELDRVKKVMAGEFARSVGTAFEIGDLYQAISICNLPSDFYHTYLDKIRAVSIEDIQHVARNFLNPDEMVEIVVG